MGHQKAAVELITDLFTPQTAIQTPVARTCLDWYARIDNSVAIMGGFPATLPREYMEGLVGFYSTQTEKFPNNLNWKLALRSSRIRLFRLDISLLYARGARGQISASGFQRDHERLTEELTNWKKSSDACLTDSACLITDINGRRPDPDDIVNPFGPGVLYGLPIFSTTVADTEWHSIMIIHKSQCSRVATDTLLQDMQNHAYAVCRNYETIELWPNSPKGAITLFHPHLQLAALFLPQDSHHRNWIRRKFALSEQMG